MKNPFITELLAQAEYETKAQHRKDIIIVVHDQYELVKKCIESIYENTTNFKLYLWDNASKPQTANYLQSLTDVVLHRHPKNIGFIQPNNYMAQAGNSDYIILLNSDTEVKKGWDTALIGFLESNPKVAITGYRGGLLEKDGSAFYANYGYKVDYICGWCMCFSRDIYDKFKLFDDELLEFAYFEDSDFSLRVKTAGYDVYALNLDLVLHHQNATIKEVEKERDTKKTFLANQARFTERWYTYLSMGRVLSQETSEEKRISMIQ